MLLKMAGSSCRPIAQRRHCLGATNTCQAHRHLEVSVPNLSAQPPSQAISESSILKRIQRPRAHDQLCRISHVCAKMSSSCFGFRRSRDGRETEPLLPRYNDDTTLQTRLHEKLHTYQMLRALSKGYMPSNEQLVINLRALLSADVLNPETSGLSASGHALVLNIRLLLKQLIELLIHKNSQDQIQDFIWYLSKSRVAVDTYDISRRASQAKAKADTVAGESSTAHDSTQIVLADSMSQRTRASRRLARCCLPTQISAIF